MGRLSRFLGGLAKMQIHNKLIPSKIRILLYLLDSDNPESKFDVPIGLTQIGIAQKISASQGYTPRVLKKLLNLGYVQECMGHTKCYKRRHKYYILTKEGGRYARRMKKELSDFFITLKLPDDISEIMAFKDIITYLEKEKICWNITEVDICNNISEDSTLNIESLENIREKKINDITN
jgi:DNA-binding MarR family transcriptional regulator